MESKPEEAILCFRTKIKADQQRCDPELSAKSGAFCGSGDTPKNWLSLQTPLFGMNKAPEVLYKGSPQAPSQDTN